MAILLYDDDDDDDFRVCVFRHVCVLACHSGFLEGYYFSMMIFVCFICVKKLRSLLYRLGGRIHGMLKEQVEMRMRGGEGGGVVLLEDGERK